MEGITLSNILNLGVAGIAILVVFILALILYRVMNNKFGSILSTSQGQTNSPTCSNQDSRIIDSVGRAHERLDDHVKEHMKFMENCNIQHHEISKFMGTIGANVATLLTTQSEIKNDIIAIRNGGKK